MLYAFFWVIPRHLNFISRRFRTLSVPSSYEDGTDSVLKCQHIEIQTPGNYPEESIQSSERGESLKLPRRKHTKFRMW